MIRRWMSLGCVLALAGVWGCDGGGGTDSGVAPGTDGGPVGTDSGMMMMAGPVGHGATRDSLTAADYSCRGTRTFGT